MFWPDMNTLDSYALLLIVAIPMVGAGLLILIPGSRILAVRRFALAVALVTMLLSAYVFLAYDHSAGGMQFGRIWNWLEIPGPWPMGESGITLRLGVDGISALMVLLTGIVLFTGVLVSWNIEDRAKEFFVLYLLLLAGVFGVFVTLDMFFFFFFYELAVMPMYLLIGVWGSSSTFPTFIRAKEYGAMKLMLYLVAGSVLIWIALIAIFTEAGLGTFNLVALSEVEFSEGFQRVFFPFLVVGFGVLAGLWPFHTWSPDGHVAAPTAVSMVHAGGADEAGRVRRHSHWHDADAGGRGVLDASADSAGNGERDIRRVVGDGADGPEVCHRLFEREPHGLRHYGNSDAASARTERRGVADVQPRRNDRAVSSRRSASSTRRRTRAI